MGVGVTQTAALRCSGCGRFLGEPVRVVPVRDSIHPYTADYEYLCGQCAHDAA